MSKESLSKIPWRNGGWVGFHVAWHLPPHIILGQHAVDRHHVQSIGVLPARLQKPLLLRAAHIRVRRAGKNLCAGILFSDNKSQMLTWESRDWQASTPARAQWRRCRFSIITWPNRSLMFTWMHWSRSGRATSLCYSHLEMIYSTLDSMCN